MGFRRRFKAGSLAFALVTVVGLTLRRMQRWFPSLYNGADVVVSFQNVSTLRNNVKDGVTSNSSGSDNGDGLSVINRPENDQLMTGPTSISAEDESYKRIVYHDSEDRQAMRMRETKRPIAVVHIGPGKTATTTIQWTLAQRKTLQLLGEDGYEYIPRSGSGDERCRNGACLHRMCTGSVPGCQMTAGDWDDLRKYAQLRRDQKTGIILSMEALSAHMDHPQSPRSLQVIGEFLPVLEGFDVRLVGSYRRYHEWILSYFNQMYKKPHEAGRATFADSEGGALLPPPINRTHLARWAGSSLGSSNLTIFNIHAHSQEELVTGFICQGIPGAVKTCKAGREGKLPVPAQPKNEAVTWAVFEALQVSALASRKGLIPTKQVSSFAKKLAILLPQAKRVNMTIHKICPSQERLQIILNQSLEYERVMVPEYHRAGGRLELEESFAQYVQEDRYCNIDAERLIASDALHGLLKSFK